MNQIRNTNIHVLVEGNGPQGVVLLHGWGQNAYMMKFLQDHLCAEYTVVNMDLPGFGQSEEPKRVWTIQDYALMLEELLDKLHIQKPILIAHSFGARIALRYSAEHEVKQLILTGAAGIKPHHSLVWYGKVYTYKLLKKLHVANRMGSVDYQQASGVMRGILVASVEEDLRPLLPRIRCETLLVWGEKDSETPLWMGKVMEKTMPHATLIVLPKEDHFAYFHCSQQFLRIVDAFLKG